MVSDQIRYFVTIVETGSYMEAALELNISQSTISKQIQNLEHELGVSLFDRTSRKARLTEAGRQLLPEMRALLDHMDHLIYSASKLRPGYAKHFSVVTLPFIGYLGLYPPLGRFELDNPEFQLEIKELEEPQLMRQMLNNDFDLAITYEHEYRRANLSQEFIPILEDEIVLILHRGTPLSERRSVRLEELEDMPLLLMEPYTCVAKTCFRYFQSQHYYLPNIIFRGRPDTAFGGVAAGRGAAFLTRRQCQLYSPREAVMVPLDPPLPLVVGVVPGMNEAYREETGRLIQLLTESG